jgi:molecular chaperone DnaJ
LSNTQRLFFGIAALLPIFAQIYMAPKDYYSILQLQPGASLDDIKKAYRQLAMRYHPDKLQGNTYAAAYFQEVREAYEVLSDPRKREEYHLQRNHWKSSGRSFANSNAITPAILLKEAKVLYEKVRQMDIFRMDLEGVQRQILQLVSDEVLAQLKSFGDGAAEEDTLHFLMEAAKPLPYSMVTEIAIQWGKLPHLSQAALQRIQAFLKERRRAHLKERFRTPLLMVVALLLCYLVYRLARA